MGSRRVSMRKAYFILFSIVFGPIILGFILGVMGGEPKWAKYNITGIQLIHSNPELDKPDKCHE